jgi:hypothetical protein
MRGIILDRLRACGRNSPANALNPGVSQLSEADPGSILEKFGNQAKISAYFITLASWRNSLYSPYTLLLQKCEWHLI